MMGVPVTAVSFNRHDMGYVSRYVKERIFARIRKSTDEFLRLLIGCAKRYDRALLIPNDRRFPRSHAM
jgi:hypothetical protein